MPDPMQPRRAADDLAVLHALADAARAAILPYFRADGLNPDNKSAAGFDPVTAADRAAEQVMRAVLADRRPEDGVFGEEFGVDRGRSGRLWVLDPIDGTRSFMSGMPIWGVLIALYDAARADPRPILGAIDQPYLGERFLGGEDADGAPWAKLIDRAGERRLQARACADLAQATLFCTDPVMFAAGAERAAFDAVSARARLTRYGSDCYGYAMVAAGQADLVIESSLHPYDVQALIPVLRGAGGLLTDWSGGPAFWGGQVLAAGDARAHAQALALLAPAARETPAPF